MIAVEKEDLTNDKNPNCSWRWMTYKKRLNEEEEARAFVKKHEKAILSLKLHLFERE